MGAAARAPLEHGHPHTGPRVALGHFLSWPWGASSCMVRVLPQSVLRVTESHEGHPSHRSLVMATWVGATS